MQSLIDIETELKAVVESARARGWRTVDLEHVLGRNGDRRSADLVANLDAGIERWRERRRLRTEAALLTARFVLQVIARLPALPVADDGAVRVDSGLLFKVRALLAKAESTEFAAEAEALMAKAHQLMARHAIDQAMLNGGRSGDEVVARRILLADPYAKSRFLLLSSVARASACRAIFWQGLGLATVHGLPADVEATELLYTSLLVQATSGAARAPVDPRDPPARKAAYRRAFLAAFAARIGVRLRAASEESLVDARREHGDALLPVLASRQAAVDAAISAVGTRPLSASVSDGRGWAAGTRAADRATIAGQPSMPVMPGQLPNGS